MIKKNLSLFNWTFLGVIIYSISQWLIVLILNKNFDYVSVGMYTYSLAIVSPFFIFSYLQLRSVYITRVLDGIELFVKLRIYLLIITFIGIVTIGFVSNNDSNYHKVIIAISLVKIAEGIADIIYAYFHREQKMREISVSIIIRSLTSIIIFYVIYTVTKDFNLSFFLYSIYTIIFVIIYDFLYLYIRKAGLSLGKNTIKNYYTLFLIGLPMGIVTFIASLSVSVPRYILENKASLELLGIFGSLIYLITVMTKMTTSLSQVLSPKLSNAFNQKKLKLFIKISVIGILINLVIGIFLMVLIFFGGDYILAIIYTNEYKQYKDEFLYLAFYGLITFLGGFVGNILTAMRVFKMQVYIHVLKLVIITITSLLIIDNNLFNIITAMIIGAAFSVIIYTLVVFYKLRKEVQKYE